MPASDFTTYFNFALSSDDDFNWGDDFRSNLDKADSSLKEMSDLAANFSSSIGTHLISTDHHWRYYTQEEFDDDGQLDTIYYTETELDNGALDSRYPNKNITRTKADVYSKTEMDSLFYKKSDFVAGSALVTTLDARYYTQSAINGGILDDLFYTKTEGDALLVERGNEEKAKLTGGSFDDHVVKFQIQPVGQVDLFDPDDPNASRTVSNLKASAFYVFTYATPSTIDSYPYSKRSVELVDRYGYALEEIRPGFPAGYPCAFTYDKDSFTNTIGQSVSSIWVPASVNQLEDVDSDGDLTGDARPYFGGEMLSLVGTQLKSTYGTTPNEPDPPPDQPEPGLGPFSSNIFYYAFQTAESGLNKSYYITTNTSSPDLSATSQSAAFFSNGWSEGGFYFLKDYYYGYTSVAGGGRSGSSSNSLVKFNYDGDVLRSVKLSYTFTEPDTSLSATPKSSDWDYYTDSNGIKRYYIHDIWVDEANNAFYTATHRAVRKFNLSTGSLIRTLASNDGTCGQIRGGCYIAGIGLKGAHLYIITITKTSLGDQLNSTTVKDVNTGSTKASFGIYRYNTFPSNPSQRETPWDLFFYNGQFYYVRADSTTLMPRIDVWASEDVAAIGGGTVTVVKDAGYATSTPLATYNPGNSATADRVTGSTYYNPIY